MGLTDNIQSLTGVVTVQIEGFFTERFINLCKINNIKIWDVRNIVKGVMRFKINIKDFKKLRKISKKTKCKVLIKEKKGVYFTLFKYRKRKIVFVLLFIVLIFSISFSTFVWNIEVIGNETISKEEIIDNLKESGLFIGKSKIGLDKKDIVNNFRTKSSDVSWAGLEIDGTRAIIKVVEKTRIDENNVQKINPGDIVATKSGVITKIVAEKGTSKCKVMDYVEKGNVLVEGNVYSRDNEIMEEVPAKGYAMIDSIYTFEKEYLFTKTEKNYTGKKRTTFGITVDSKENMLNYLNKSKKYDITKQRKSIRIFGKSISFDIFKCDEYEDITVDYTKDELNYIIDKEINEYLQNNILNNCINSNVVDITKNEYEIENGIKIKVEYVINEKIGEFVERGT